MSNTDSFIEEVTEEVRRDRLFGLMRRYGWIAVVVVLAIVGGAAYSEWTSARARAAAEAKGDALLAALELPDAAARVAALREIPNGEGSDVVKGLLLAGQLHAAGDAAGAASVLTALSADYMLDPVWRDLVILKWMMIGAEAGIGPQERIEKLAPIATAGAPYRLLAEEQIAIAQIELGHDDAAIGGLQAIARDSAATEALRRRAAQLIVALGGDPANL